ncbi:hypothetical protein AX17_007162 [Amanita inopinata Kibby_2008]|nr:hypothetical protein AX17_007162 [Amanita inopinata Kibby_2008]
MRLSIAAVTTALVLAGLSHAIPVTYDNAPADLVARYNVREMDIDQLYSRSFDDESRLFARIYVPPPSQPIVERPIGSTGGVTSSISRPDNNGNGGSVVYKPPTGSSPHTKSHHRYEEDLYRRGNNKYKGKPKADSFFADVYRR